MLMDSLNSFVLEQVTCFHVMEGYRLGFFPHIILVIWHFANLHGCLITTC